MPTEEELEERLYEYIHKQQQEIRKALEAIGKKPVKDGDRK